MKAKYIQPAARVYHIAQHSLLLSNLSSQATNDDQETISNINVYTDVNTTKVSQTNDVW